MIVFERKRMCENKLLTCTFLRTFSIMININLYKTAIVNLLKLLLVNTQILLLSLFVVANLQFTKTFWPTKMYKKRYYLVKIFIFFSDCTVKNTARLAKK